MSRLFTPYGCRTTAADVIAEADLSGKRVVVTGGASGSGRYFEDCTESPVLTRRPVDFSGGVAAYALDSENADRLWDATLKLIA